MEKRLVVHVGPAKTGTTSIQQALNTDHDMLLAHGWHVPVTSTYGRTQGHHNIGRELHRDPRFHHAAGTLDQLADEIRTVDAQSALISSEAIGKEDRDGLKYAALRRFADRLGRKLVVVAVVRDYLTLATSSYVHAVRNMSYSASFRRFGARKMARPSFYTASIEPLERVADELVLIAYSDDVVDSLYTALDLPARPESERLNQGVGPLLVELCRVLAHHYRTMGLLAGGASPKEYRRLVETAQRLIGPEPPYWGYQPGEADETFERYLAADEPFFARHGFAMERRDAGMTFNDVSVSRMEPRERGAFMQLVGRSIFGVKP